MKKIIFGFLMCFTMFGGISAQNTEELSKLYINILVESDKSIFVENTRLKQNEIAAWVRNFVHKQPSVKYDGVVYKIFGDENLSLGFIMDVSNELLNGFNQDVQIKRHLLNLKELDINGSNYIEKLNKLNIKSVKE